MNNFINIRKVIINEIGLEGLDGITLQTLWIRIAEESKTNLPFPERLQETYWNIIRKIAGFNFFELETPRPDYVSYDRFQLFYENEEILEEQPEDIYPFNMINDTAHNIIGSCSTYNTRKNVTSEARAADYTKAKSWGNKLVIVASQELRTFALIGSLSFINIDLSPIQYCLLERIGRSRYHGEITQGKNSLQLLEDPKTLFYHRKTLLKHKLITKQSFFVKNGQSNVSGSLLHLQRYYVERKPKNFILTERIVEFLKTQPLYRADYTDVVAQLQLSNSIKKLVKTNEFLQFVKIEFIPLREMFPNSPISKWKQKNADKEKTVRIMQLINPDVDVSKNWFNEDVEEEEEESGFKDYGNLCLGMPIMYQAASIIRESGENGCCQSDLSNIMGLGRLSARALCRNLVRKDVVTCIMDDVGRQRVTRFVSRKFEKDGQKTVQFNEEREKLMTLMSGGNTNTSLDSYAEISSQASSQNLSSDDQVIDANNINLDSILNNKNHVIENQTDSNIIIEIIDKKNSTDDSVNANLKNIKIESVETARKKRHLDKSNVSSEPAAKKAKSEEIELPEELKAKIGQIDVQILVAKSDPKIKGYEQGLEDHLKKEEYTPFSSGSLSQKYSLTYRLLKRANFIIECVRQHKVIADLTKLIKMIQENEKDEGYLIKIDKKSLIRLLLKLAKDGQIKYIKVTMNSNRKTKQLTFVCEPNIEETHSIIQSEIDQAKMKFFIDSFKPESKNLKADDNKDEFLKNKYEFDKKVARDFGFCPKFVRMRLIHELLFYLIYNTQDEIPLTEPEEKKQWLQKLNIPYDDKLIEEMSPIYRKKELNWKTFIPPIPQHVGWPKGWTIMSDVLVRLPFITFMQCCGTSFNIEGIERFLRDPVRKYFLLCNIPGEIRKGLLYKRKYMYQIHEVISRLCYIGLTQFGPQHYREKDQLFVYLNRKTSMLNTTISKPNYHEITSMTYEKHEYVFDKFSDVEHYWYDLWSTCMHTRLNSRLSVTGKYVIVEQLHTKHAMLEAVKPVQPDEAPLKDTGKVPGDSLGAAGLDSSLFAHLKRNWSWHTNSEMFDQTPKPPANIKRRKVNDCIVIHNPRDPNELIEVAVNKQTIPGNTKIFNKFTRCTNIIRTDQNKQKKYIIKQKTIVRKILPKSMRKRKKPVYDDIDKLALTKMAKLRTDWSPIEDHIVLLCSIASVYLCPNRHKKTISFSVIRDVLHRLVDHSASKTSKACQRRILYMMKNPHTRRSVNMCMEEVRQNENISKKYKHICDKIQKEHVKDEELNIAFVELVSQLTSMFANLIKSGRNKSFVIPSTIQEFKESFRICGAAKKMTSINKDPQNTNEIQCSVIKTIIHSSMCCTKDKSSWAYQLFKVYQQYPETLLRSVITKTRLDQLISLKKSYSIAKRSSIMPFSSSPYKLSINYFNMLLTKIPYTSFQDASDLFKNIIEWSNIYKSVPRSKFDSRGLEIDTPGSGTAIVLMELLEKIEVKIEFEIPDDIIVLDQNIVKDKTYERIVERFYNILRDPMSVQKWEEKQVDDTTYSEDVEPEAETDSSEIVTPAVPLNNPENTATHPRMNSRIAFHMMRAEVCEGLDEKSTQHMHDFFVVNACRVFVNLPHLIKSPGEVKFEDICEDFATVFTDVTPKLLHEIKEVSVIPNECATEDEIIQYLMGENANDEDINFVKEILDFILEQGVLGATTEELMSFSKSLRHNCNNGNLSLIDVLEVAIELKIILQTGVEMYRYVHFQHKNPWIIKSYKILRLEKEKIPVAGDETTNEEFQEHFGKHRKNFSYLELQKSKQRLDLTTQKEIKILLSPWLRIDGTLNRRVLDKWLGTILIACLEQPGINLKAIATKFYHLKPVDTFILVKYLTKLKCVRQYKIQKPKPTLFSGVPNITFVPATFLDDPKIIHVEPYCDAVSKFSIFIGDKTYASHFLSQYCN